MSVLLNFLLLRHCRFIVMKSHVIAISKTKAPVLYHSMAVSRGKGSCPTNGFAAVAPPLVYVRTHARTYVRTYVRTYINTYVRTYTRTHARTRERTHARAHVRPYVDM